ncbi:MAG TPA: STAS domain-containing protein [Candidatus Xenobia bacterium]|nr:STAS domain-containing protein [Candidatus Xenobia bacterium]
MSTKEVWAGMCAALGRGRGAGLDDWKRKLAVRVEQRPAATILHVEGELKHEYAPAVNRSLEQLWRARPRRVVVNLENCTFMDTSGVATLLGVKQQAEERGASLVLVALHPQVRNVLELSRVITRFETCATLEDALAK